MKNNNYHNFKYQQKRENRESQTDGWRNDDYLLNNDHCKKYRNTKHILWNMLSIADKKKVVKSYVYGIPQSIMWTTDDSFERYPEFNGNGFKEFLDYLLYETEDYRYYRIKLRDESINQLLKYNKN